MERHKECGQENGFIYIARMSYLLHAQSC